MADLKYIMQGFQEDINFLDEIKEVLEKDDFTSVWILTAFINERAIYNLMPSIKKSKADISFIIGIRNNVSTYQALECLININVSVFVFRSCGYGKIEELEVLGCWHDHDDPLKIRLVDKYGETICFGYGTDH